jgi:hypothetical protein
MAYSQASYLSPFRCDRNHRSAGTSDSNSANFVSSKNCVSLGRNFRPVRYGVVYVLGFRVRVMVRVWVRVRVWVWVRTWVRISVRVWVWVRCRMSVTVRVRVWVRVGLHCVSLSLNPCGVLQLEIRARYSETQRARYKVTQGKTRPLVFGIWQPVCHVSPYVVLHLPPCKGTKGQWRGVWVRIRVSPRVIRGET